LSKYYVAINTTYEASIRTGLNALKILLKLKRQFLNDLCIFFHVYDYKYVKKYSDTGSQSSYGNLPILSLGNGIPDFCLLLFYFSKFLQILIKIIIYHYYKTFKNQKLKV
jgi:hypothetical protein